MEYSVKIDRLIDLILCPDILYSYVCVWPSHHCLSYLSIKSPQGRIRWINGARHFFAESHGLGAFWEPVTEPLYKD